MAEIKQRRPRGKTPLGDCETSNTVALQVVDSQRQADRIKSERLHALRQQSAELQRNRVEK